MTFSELQIRSAFRLTTYSPLSEGTLLNPTHIKCSQKCLGGDFLVEKLTTSSGQVELCDLCTVRATASCNGNCVRITVWLCLTVNVLQIANKGVHVLLTFELFQVFHVLRRFLPTTLSIISTPIAFWKCLICRVFFNISHSAFSTINHTIFNINICSKIIEQTFFYRELVRKITCTVDIFILCSP